MSLAYDDKVILDDVSFELIRGRTKFVLGASGAGKSTLLKLVLGLIRPDSGSIWVSGKYVNRLNEQELRPVRAEIGMVFQENALFDSLTVRDNVAYRLYEEEGLSAREADRRAEDTLGFVGLAGFGDRMPAELSGGQRRRVGIARAMAFKPRILLYDEATTGLDPITADTVDDEIIKLRDLENVSSIVVTHQLRDAFRVATHEAVREGDRVAIIPADEAKAEEAEFIMLRDGRIFFEGHAAEIREAAKTDSYLKAFLSSH